MVGGENRVKIFLKAIEIATQRGHFSDGNEGGLFEYSAGAGMFPAGIGG